MTRRMQLSGEVASHVRELIITGRVKPGEFLRMEPIAEELGVSITPVREGLLTLSGEGFVDLMPRRGFVVCEFTPQDVRDLFWAQAQLAGELAARAADRAGEADVVWLEANIADHVVAVAAGDEARVAALGHAFHRHLNKLADSPRLARLLRTIVGQLPNTFYASIEGHLETTDEDHVQIVEALGRGDGQTCRTIMERHILDGAERLVRDLQARGLWSDEHAASLSA